MNSQKRIDSFFKKSDSDTPKKKQCQEKDVKENEVPEASKSYSLQTIQVCLDLPPSSSVSVQQEQKFKPQTWLPADACWLVNFKPY